MLERGRETLCILEGFVFLRKAAKTGVCVVGEEVPQ